MAKFCTKCGSPLSENAAYCTNCGAVVDQKSNVTFSEQKKHMVIKIGSIAAVLIVIVLIFTALFSGGYKSALDNFFEGIEDGDVSALMDAMPECEIEYLENSLKEYDIYDSVKDYFEATFSVLLKGMESEFGDDISISYDIINKEELSDKQLKSIQNDLRSSFNAKDTEVTKGYNVKMNVKIKGDNKTEKETISLKVAKVDGDWCLVENNFYSIF